MFKRLMYAVMAVGLIGFLSANVQAAGFWSAVQGWFHPNPGIIIDR